MPAPTLDSELLLEASVDAEDGMTVLLLLWARKAERTVLAHAEPIRQVRPGDPGRWRADFRHRLDVDDSDDWEMFMQTATIRTPRLVSPASLTAAEELVIGVVAGSTHDYPGFGPWMRASTAAEMS
jgi:hypothetical protein